MTGAELITAVLDDGGFGSSDPQITRARVLAWLNRGLARIPALVRDAPWLNQASTVSVTVGDADHAFAPSGLVEVRRVTWVVGDVRRTLERIPQAEMNDKLGERAGTPSQWSFEQGTLFVFPAPDTAGQLVVDWTGQDVTLADAGTPVLLLPVELHELLVNHATYHAFLAVASPRAGDFVPVDHPRSVSQLRRAVAKRLGPARPRSVDAGEI